MKKVKKVLFLCMMMALLAQPFGTQPSAQAEDNSRPPVLNEFEALDENMYTPATYRLASMAYQKVKELMDNPDATQDKIQDAINALEQRMAELRVQNGSASLWQTYEDYFEIGNIYSGPGNLDPSTVRGALTSDHFNSLTAENHMKPENLSYGNAGEEGRFTIYEGSNHISDQLVREARASGKTVHGHVLVWHSQSPDWVNGGTGGNYTRAQAKENMEHYIKTAVEHFDTYYPGVVTSWDVVNEAFVDGVANIPEDANWKDYLREGNQSGWYKSYSNGMKAGEDPSDFIYDAFVFARKYTDAKLFYNDFNMYQDGERAECTVQKGVSKRSSPVN